MQIRHPNHIVEHTNLAPFGSLVSYRLPNPANETKFETGHDGIVVGYYQHDNGVLDGSWLIVDS